MVRVGDPRHPRADAHDRLRRRIVGFILDRKISDLTFGRRLPRLLHEAGLVDGYNEGRTQIFRGATAPARFWQATQAMTLARMVAEGVCTEAEAAEFSAAYEDPTFDFVGMTLIATRARRAPDG